MTPDPFQYYPTPLSLATRLWQMFVNRDFKRILEPSAGEGALLAGLPEEYARYRDRVPVDCCEIDISKHAVLRQNGYSVVGHDFLQFGSGVAYSHIIMNPPFATGVEHVLKAWDIMWNGEICCVLNAESIRNPHTKERRMLVALIEQHGEVEFVADAFLSDDTERKTPVDVALVHLTKRADLQSTVFGDLIGELRRDAETGAGLSGSYKAPQAIALPTSFVENAVLAFNAAVQALTTAALHGARADYYAHLLGQTMAERNGDMPLAAGTWSADAVQTVIHKQYLELKDRAWSNILRSTHVLTRLSQNAQRRLESEFEAIRQLEFTVVNIYGFLEGLVAKQGEVQIGMVLDVFDSISRYHSDNRVYYRGWVSNSKHRTCGMRVKTTRFIIPGHGTDGWRQSLDWSSTQFLADIDKVFAMLDGQRKPSVSLVDVFTTHFADLRAGKRVTASYFDVRYYGVGTIHFFPRSKALIDRLNRLVGQHRKWLPPEGTRVSDAFWLQYDKAEKFDKEVREEIAKVNCGSRYWDHPLTKLDASSEEERAQAGQIVDELMGKVLERHGISTDYRIEASPQGLLELAAA